MTTAFFVYATSLAVAGAVLYGGFRYFRRRPANAAPRDTSFGPPPPEVQVLGQTRIGVGRSLFIVQVEGRRLLLGSTTRHWTALADLGAARHSDDEPVDAIDAELQRALEVSRQRRGGRRP